jgi:hypothetical protein
MGADFNATNKVIYGIRMLSNIRKYKLMPEEVYSKRNCLVDDGTLSKILYYDIVQQLRQLSGLALVDADNCYDCICHPVVPMIFQAFSVPTPAIGYMLSTIQDMRFSLRTGYGDSAGYAGGTDNTSADPIKTQGMCQGNGALPAAWTGTSIPMIAIQRKKGHGVHFKAPITNKEGQLTGGLFVDNMDLFHLDMQVVESVQQAHANLQEGIINWGKLLIATGGALKPIKCLYYLISFQWKADGRWEYCSNKDKEVYAIGVPLADKSLTDIEHLSINSAVKTLGSMTCPLGSNKAGLERIRTQGQKWVDQIASGKMSRRNMWFMADRQFWPHVGYGICNNTATWEELKGCFKRIYWQMKPKGGVRGTAPAPLCQMDRGFYGVGCTHPGVECLLVQITKMLVHYGCRSGIGLQMAVLIELLTTELGVSSQPLGESFLKHGKWVTHL